MPSFSCCIQHCGMGISTPLHFPKKVNCSKDPLDKQEKAINLISTSTFQLCSVSMEKSCVFCILNVVCLGVSNIPCS